ncbi:MAG: hypothetical protein IJR42_01250 [Paludibacteraceae bacterium]|nr:hypothetical protein [Paludibacteraceae bacterium]
MAFEVFNINPKGRKTGDCVTRAIAKAAGITWQEALRLQYETSLKTGWSLTSTQTINLVLKGLGFEEQTVRPLPGTKRPTVAKLAELYDLMSVESIVVKVSGHLTCAVAGTIYDLWDCSAKPAYKFWIKYVED